MPILPVEAYYSQEWFDLEQEHIFGKTWHFAGFTEDINEPGDYITAQVGSDNILVIKGNDHKLRAFHNVCRHRGTQLLRAEGNERKAITCPYHDWTYSIEGDLLSIPNQETEFPNLNCKNMGLHKASVDIWRGMIFVHPEPQAPSILQWFNGVEEYLGPHRPEELIEYEEGMTEHTINSNWKIVAENYIDGYHLSHLHSNTLNMYDHSKQESGFVGPHYVFYEPLEKEYLDNLENYAPYPLIDHIPREQVGAYVPLLFPNLGLGEGECDWSIFLIIPIAPDKTKVITRSKVMNASSLNFAKQGLLSNAYWNKKISGKYFGKNSDDPMASGDFMAEDIFACEQQQKSLKSSRFFVGATAINLEASVRQFQQIIRDYIPK
ncbi:aromatic ring-hydroxylating dioxygenase subunit alpha [Prolixibacteraceae bacterium JC049]|nr:aromatic ring-hydroxylating dioxygenase subunit alpha [Prolixibacteraceae bacterium JC049]